MTGDHIVDGLYWGLGLVFKDRNAAPLYILPAFLAFTLALGLYAWSRSRPWSMAAKRRIEAIEAALGRDKDPLAERLAFAEKFPDVSRVLTGGDSQDLQRAWHEYHETIVDETQNPIRNTARPLAYFSRAVPNLRFLAFWSNIFVGAGLVLTFLGIVVALDTTAKGMQGGDVTQTKLALVSLLTIASAKFFASIAALISSLILRLIEGGMQRRIRTLTTKLCDLLERGLLYVSPQLLAAHQLDELKRQSAQLERFNADLAITIGEQVGNRFNTAVAPLATSLVALNDHIVNMSENLREGLGQGAADAVQAAASGELRALGQTLQGLQAKFETVREGVDQSGSDVARQIRAAGLDFAEAAAQIRQAFESLRSHIEGLGQSLTEQSEVALVRQTEAVEQAAKAIANTQTEAERRTLNVLDEIGEAGRRSAGHIERELATTFGSAREIFEALQRDIGALGESLTAKSEAAISRQSEMMDATAQTVADAQVRASDALATALEKLGEAGQRTAEQAHADIQRSLHTAAEEVRNTLAISASENATVFAESGRAVAQAVNDAASRIAALASAIERSERGAASTAQSFQATTDSAKILAGTMDHAAQQFGNAAAPFGRAAGSMQDSAEAIARTIHEAMDTRSAALEEVRVLSSGLQDTNHAAGEAWRNYKDRFAGLDEDLKSTLELMTQMLSGTMDEFRQFAQEVDRSLASAVGRLGDALGQIEEYAEALEKFTERLPETSIAAE